MRVDFYNTKQRKKLIEQLDFSFGIKKIPKIIFETGKEKLRGFSGDLSIDELYALDRIANIEFMGLYLFKQELGYTRLGFEGCLLLKDQIEKNIIEINSEQLKQWITGHNLDLVFDKGIYIIKNGDDFFGCAISDGKHLINFVPKERRIRKS